MDSRLLLRRHSGRAAVSRESAGLMHEDLQSPSITREAYASYSAHRPIYRCRFDREEQPWRDEGPSAGGAQDEEEDEEEEQEEEEGKKGGKPFSWALERVAIRRERGRGGGVRGRKDNIQRPSLSRLSCGVRVAAGEAVGPSSSWRRRDDAGCYRRQSVDTSTSRSYAAKPEASDVSIPAFTAAAAAAYPGTASRSSFLLPPAAAASPAAAAARRILSSSATAAGGRVPSFALAQQAWESGTPAQSLAGGWKRMRSSVAAAAGGDEGEEEAGDGRGGETALYAAVRRRVRAVRPRAAASNRRFSAVVAASEKMRRQGDSSNTVLTYLPRSAAASSDSVYLSPAYATFAPATAHPPRDSRCSDVRRDSRRRPSAPAPSAAAVAPTAARRKSFSFSPPAPPPPPLLAAAVARPAGGAVAGRRATATSSSSCAAIGAANRARPSLSASRNFASAATGRAIAQATTAASATTATPATARTATTEAEEKKGPFPLSSARWRPLPPLSERLHAAFRHECEELFLLHDVKRCGRVDVELLPLLLRSLGQYWPAAALRTLQQRLAVRGVTCLTFSPFFSLACKGKQWRSAAAIAADGRRLLVGSPAVEQQLLHAFTFLDRMGKGSLLLQDLKHYLTRVGPEPLSEAEWKTLTMITADRRSSTSSSAAAAISATTADSSSAAPPAAAAACAPLSPLPAAASSSSSSPSSSSYLPFDAPVPLLTPAATTLSQAAFMSMFADDVEDFL